MGIKDLGTFVKKNDLDCYFEKPLSVFAGKIVGFDALNIVCTTIPSVVQTVIEKKENFLEEISPEEISNLVEKRIMSLNKKFLERDVIPLWIWDGESKGNKGDTQAERRKQRAKNREKRAVLYTELKNMDPLEITPEKEKTYKNLVSTTTFIPKETMKRIKTITTDLGIPTITAEDEAENLASSLAVEGKISAVYSTDTDTYPLGAPRVIKKLIHKENDVYVSGVLPYKIVEGLDLTFPEFRDMCIMFGTDFNDRIHRIGPKKSLEMIRRFKNLETIEQNTKHNLTFMNYKEVRKQLTPYTTYYQPEDHLKLKKCYDQDFIDSICQKYPHLDINSLFSVINSVISE